MITWGNHIYFGINFDAYIQIRLTLFEKEILCNSDMAIANSVKRFLMPSWGFLENASFK